MSPKLRELRSQRSLVRKKEEKHIFTYAGLVCRRRLVYLRRFVYLRSLLYLRRLVEHRRHAVLGTFS